MKKALIVIITAISILGILKLNEHTLIESKITYEVVSSRTNLTLNSASSSLEKLDTVSVISKVNYDEFKYECTLDETATMEEVDAFKRAKREAGKIYHSTINQKAFSTLNITNYDSYYVGVYTPFIEYNFDKETFNTHKEEILKKVTSHKDVTHVTVREGSVKSEDKLFDSITQAKIGSYYYDEDEYFGEGIKIGILETGVFDETNANFVNTNYAIIDQFMFDEPVTYHATVMASIITGEYGIAPEAIVYSCAIKGSIIEEIEFFVNREVDVMNLSFCESNLTGTYNFDSAYVDYAVKTYDMVAVAGAGNEGQSTGYVGNPGLGYNVITVGSSSTSDTPMSLNSYVTVTGPKKPTLIAPGDCLYVPNVGAGNTGTSASAAVTTGCVALLLEEYPILKTRPMQVVSLFVAGAVRQSGYTGTKVANGFELKSGAGRIDLKKTMDTMSKTTVISNDMLVPSTSGTSIYEFSVYILGNQNLRAAFSWPATINTNNNSASFTRYTAAIYDDYGNCLASGSSINENVVLASCIVPEEGRYYMRLYQDSNLVGSEDKIYFAYRYR